MSQASMAEQGRKRVTVVVADDHPLYREGVVRALLASGQIEILAEAGDGREALAAIQEHQPDVALLDYKLPELDGVAVTHAVAREQLPTRVLLVSAFTDSGVVYKALETGAAGFVSKEAILGGVWEAGLHGPFVLLSVTVFLTAFYMFRAVFLTFFGGRGAGSHPHDPPGVMMGPLWVLTVLSIAGTVLGGAALGLSFPDFLRGSMGERLPHGPHWLTPFSVGLALFPTLIMMISLVGWFIAGVLGAR